MGIEPTSEAWEASILPLYDARLLTSRLYTTPQFSVHVQALPYSKPYVKNFARNCQMAVARPPVALL